MNKHDSIEIVLRRISRRNPALESIANSAIDSLSEDDFSVNDQVEVAKRLAISNGIDVDLSEDDPDMLLTALSEAVIRMSEKLALSETATDIEIEEPTDQEVDAAYRKCQELRRSLKTFGIAETKCGETSGFWEQTPSVFHHIYASMLLDLCQKWQIDPLQIWDKKARG